MSWLLDADVLSQAPKGRGDPRVIEKTGLRMPLADSYIAATGRRYRLTVITGNDRDFRRPGVKVFNPFKELP